MASTHTLECVLTGKDEVGSAVSQVFLVVSSMSQVGVLTNKEIIQGQAYGIEEREMIVWGCPCSTLECLTRVLAVQLQTQPTTSLQYSGAWVPDSQVGDLD